MNSARYISNIVFRNDLDRSSYLNDLPIIKYLSREKHLSFSSPVTFFVGENGTGKSTLLEAIAVAYGFNAEGGSKNFTFSTNATHSELFEHIEIARHSYAKDGFFLRAESLYNVATNIDDMDSHPSFDAPIIATHSPILMAFPDAEILKFTSEGISSVKYQDTEHYKITKNFLDNPEKMLYYLLNDNE